MRLLWIKTFEKALIFSIGTAALVFVLDFIEKTENLVLPETPKATQDLKKVFLPPIKNMQIMVACMDTAYLIYYIYFWPMWDVIKQKFPYF